MSHPYKTHSRAHRREPRPFLRTRASKLARLLRKLVGLQPTPPQAIIRFDEDPLRPPTRAA